MDNLKNIAVDFECMTADDALKEIVKLCGFDAVRRSLNSMQLSEHVAERTFCVKGYFGGSYEGIGLEFDNLFRNTTGSIPLKAIIRVDIWNAANEKAVLYSAECTPLG